MKERMMKILKKNAWIAGLGTGLMVLGMILMAVAGIRTAKDVHATVKHIVDELAREEA